MKKVDIVYFLFKHNINVMGCAGMPIAGYIYAVEPALFNSTKTTEDGDRFTFTSTHKCSSPIL